MKLMILLSITPMLLFSANAVNAQTKVAPADEARAFKAAGYKLAGKQWRACDDPSPAYTPGAVEAVRDLNGDGLPEALFTEGSAYCYGNAGAGYSLVSKQADGNWKRVTDGAGVLTFLSTKGTGGWPDIEIGGPGFCFPVQRWNGQEYVLQRYQYEGKTCSDE